MLKHCFKQAGFIDIAFFCEISLQWGSGAICLNPLKERQYLCQLGDLSVHLQKFCMASLIFAGESQDTEIPHHSKGYGMSYK
jgi:hypothetical protein